MKYMYQYVVMYALIWAVALPLVRSTRDDNGDKTLQQVTQGDTDVQLATAMLRALKACRTWGVQFGKLERRLREVQKEAKKVSVLLNKKSFKQEPADDNYRPVE